MWVQGGGTLQVKFVDPDNDDSLEGVFLRIRRKDMRYGPRVRFFGSRREGSVRVKPGLPAGTYWLSYGAKAFRPDMPEYETQQDALEVEIKRGETTEVEIRLQGRPMTDEEIAARCPFRATGTVRDQDGRPVADAEVTVWDRIHRELWGRTKTNAEGRYEMRFGSQMASSLGELYRRTDHLVLDRLVVLASKPGWIEAEMSRQGLSHAANRAVRPADDEPEVDSAKLFLPEQSREIDFTLVPEVRATVKLLDARERPLAKRRVELGGPFAPLFLVPDFHSTDQQGIVKLPGVPTGQPHQVDLQSVRSDPLVFRSGGDYDIIARTEVDQATGLPRVVIVSIKDQRGREWRDQVVGTLEPAAEEDTELRTAGLALLQNVLVANRYWLGVPPAETQSYSYEFEYDDGVSHRIVIDYPPASGLYSRRGITYYCPLDAVARDLSNAIIEGVEREGTIIKLKWRVRRSFQAAAGFGLRGRHFGGYFATRLDRGTFVIDARTYKLLESRTENLVETYSDYAELRDGHYVPRKISVDFKREGWTPFHWQFRVHEPGLWLFDKGTRQTPDKTYTAAVRNVVVNP